ncbi:putative 4-diphosphocytidyl-2-C-methyl-d-erythritol kinase [Brachyspira pilosicoli]|uniref:4-(cytidine 5'-diphospho)-2-C-methyl-D-erythritol kinase n=1 Tax=Brachyspira pilosicoli TaxID=52584 RepID=UPI000E164A1E|nr:4-(cytidine 5'-diphospho)-2-C-methyl-D-erythritol kinase [Brachyspira pilosicoli]SUW08743.1 putative 4-diphosphocytidyl-2-C-methyl-d-erythritol kinase [Brachyspira pilosicoli]
MTELKSPCKVNLFLDITSKREDGYHLIESLFHTVDLYDIIEIKESNSFKITTSGKYKLNDNNEDNILSRIFFFFKDNMNLKKSYKINIEKNIPNGAGLGGGSSNAGLFIKFILKELEIKENEQLIKSFSKFGADIPFFIKRGMSWVNGIGENIFHYNYILPYKIIIIYPNIHVSTKVAYSNFKTEDFNKANFLSFKSIFDNKELDFNNIYNNLYNVFENNVFSLEPKIKEYKEQIENKINKKIVMSGSGSSLFTLYDNDDKKIENDYNILKEEFPHLDVFKLALI